MMKSKNISVPAVFASLLALATAPAATLLVDFGVNNETTGTDANGKVWNNVSSGRLSGTSPDPNLIGSPLISSLVDSTGAATGISMAAQLVATTGQLKIGGSAVDADGGVGTSPTGTVHVESAANDSLFLNSKEDPTSNYYQVTIGGLDANLTYDFHFLAAAEGGNDNGNASFTVIGASTKSGVIPSFVMKVDPTDDNLDQNFLSITGVVPDINDEITIRLTSTFATGTGESNARWNSMEIVSVPEPGAVSLLAAGTIGFGLRRRRP